MLIIQFLLIVMGLFLNTNEDDVAENKNAYYQPGVAISFDDAYMEHEIYPMMKLMHKNNLYPTTFAYPYGTRNAATE